MKKKHEENMEVPIVPLIDVAWILIIFFVITGVQQSELVDDTVKLAQANVSAVKQMEKMTLIINVHEDGTLNIARRTLSLPELKQILKATRESGTAEVPIILRCDAKTPYAQVDKVMQTIGAAGLYKVRISAIAGHAKSG